MIKLSVLSSGSCGNATFISDGTTRLLIDAGITRPVLDKKLASIGEDPMSLDGCLLTHEHTDHKIGVRGLATKYQVPIYCTDGTHLAIEADILDTAVETKRLVPDKAYAIGTMAVLPVDVPHDSNQPVGYFVRAGEIQMAFVTDLAYIDDDLAQMLQSCRLVFLECNHDIDALAASSYPEYRKKRVRETHLSNSQVCDFLRAATWETNQHVVLGHLSAGNNDPELVRTLAQQALRSSGGPVPAVTVLAHGQQSEVFEF